MASTVYETEISAPELKRKLAALDLKSAVANSSHILTSSFNCFRGMADECPTPQPRI